jgi:integrase
LKFPLRIRFRRAEAVIYGKTDAYAFYRVAYRSAGRRVVRSFRRYSDAKAFAEQTVRELAAGHHVSALSPSEVADALAIRQALAEFQRETGQTVSAVRAVAEYLDARRRLGTAPLSEAVAAYQRAATVRQRRLADAVAEFCESRRIKAQTMVGSRPGLARQYVIDSERYVKGLSDAFPNHDLGDLTKAHLDQYLASLTHLAPMTRNNVRAAVRLFLRWCIRQDYLPHDTRLLDADGLRSEPLEAKAIEHYTPSELKRLLDAAPDEMRPVIALQALAGLRLQEALRLDWADVWRVPGHVEVASGKAKTRQRRLVTICPALDAWLRPYRDRTGPLSTASLAEFARRFGKLRQELGIASRQNGLRHGFVTYHYALHNNENLTAAQAGNSPAMVHAHYKGLATQEQGKAWFAVAPEAVVAQT